MKKILLYGIPIALIVLFLSSGYLFAPDDRLQIQRALEESTEAARQGEPGPVLDYISRSFRFGGEETPTAEISKMIKLSRPQITLINSEPQIDGDIATVVSPVQVKVNHMGYNFDQTVPRVTITLTKETGYKWLVVPEPRWRIVSVDSVGLPNY